MWSQIAARDAGTGSIHLFNYDLANSYDVRRRIPTVSVLFGCYKMPEAR